MPGWDDGWRNQVGRVPREARLVVTDCPTCEELDCSMQGEVLYLLDKVYDVTLKTTYPASAALAAFVDVEPVTTFTADWAGAILGSRQRRVLEPLDDIF